MESNHGGGEKRDDDNVDEERRDRVLSENISPNFWVLQVLKGVFLHPPYVVGHPTPPSTQHIDVRTCCLKS